MLRDGTTERPIGLAVRLHPGHATEISAAEADNIARATDRGALTRRN